MSRAIASVFEAAESVARAAGVRVRTVSGLDELESLDRLLAGIWQEDAGGPLLGTELLRALAKSGNYVAGAYDGATAVGAAAGFFSAPANRELHSHIAGVGPAGAGRGIGFALKQHQRAWALHQGATMISWTFDPLVARNAYFNLAKLAAVPTEYLPNFYGAMHDRINGDQDSDRLLVCWDLLAPAVVAATAGRPHHLARPDDATVALRRGPDGGPRPGSPHGHTVLVAVPGDIEALRREAPEVAGRWRVAVRDTLTTLLGDGLRFAGFHRDGWYVLTRPAAARRR
ncbi:GNAT family N-acetyltransferase [Actinoplanes sp. NPDC026623]|uniref:GNAT family N-acetyltransferase n=1 Tax=Actinoplanes sp. NPDC026623 TaxID=3155610 RepID=UPI0033FE888F